MSDNQQIESATPVAKGHRFPVGHPRWNGRHKATARQARQLLADMNLDPLEWLANLLRSDTYKQTVIDPVTGKKTRVEVAVPLDVRMDAAKTVCAYCYPKLSAQATQISTPNDDSAPIDVMAIIQAGDGSLARALQEAALEYGGANDDPATVPARIVPEDHTR